jgi:hypothetical protein
MPRVWGELTTSLIEMPLLLLCFSCFALCFVRFMCTTWAAAAAISVDLSLDD